MSCTLLVFIIIHGIVFVKEMEIHIIYMFIIIIVIITILCIIIMSVILCDILCTLGTIGTDGSLYTDTLDDMSDTLYDICTIDIEW